MRQMLMKRLKFGGWFQPARSTGCNSQSEMSAESVAQRDTLRSQQRTDGSRGSRRPGKQPRKAIEGDARLRKRRHGRLW